MDNKDAGWQASMVISIRPGQWVNLEGTPYYREKVTGLKTRKDAIKRLQTWMFDHFNGKIPEGTDFRIERGAERPFSMDLGFPSHPFAKEKK